MRIGIDARPLLEKQMTGVGEYTQELIRNLIIQGQEHEIRLYLSSNKKRELPNLGVEAHDKALVKWLEKPNKILSLSSLLLNRPKLDKFLGRVDVFFSPNFNFTSLDPSTPHVITVHDLSFRIYREFLSTKRKIWHRAIRAKSQAKKAEHVICDSRSTAADLSRIFGVKEEKISTVHLGVADSFRPVSDDAKLATIIKKYHLPERFILSVGTIEPRKNLVSAIQAFNRYKEVTKAKTALVIAGPRGWRSRASLEAIAKSPYNKDIISLGFVAAEDRPALYSLARCLLTVSTYEGFGLPALEAMRCGAPVIASDVSSLPEVVGDAGMLVDPERPAEIARALIELVNDETLQASLIERGLVRSQKFSWQVTAEKTLNILKAVVQNHQWEQQNITASPREKANITAA